MSQVAFPRPAPACSAPRAGQPGALLLAALFAVVGIGSADPALAVKRRAFVTSITGSPVISSWPGATGATTLDKADSVCRARAQAAGLPNANTYRAWMSVTGTDAYCHVQGLGGTRNDGCNDAPLPLPGGGPWYLANGITNFTGTLDQLTGPARVIYRPVMMDELGNTIGDVDDRLAWTGTQRSGIKLDNCNDWTTSVGSVEGLAGDPLTTANEWTEAIREDCDQARRLFCLEPGPSETSTLLWSPGAIVFLTSAVGTGDLGSWPEAQGAQGVNAGFAICRTLAARAGLPAPGSFVPWISTPLVAARDRVTTDGPFKRVDGYTVANDFDDLVDGTVDNSIHVYEDGSYLDEYNNLVWTGSDGDGTLNNHCDFWTDGTDAEFGHLGEASAARTERWTSYFSQICSVNRHLYCISNRVTLFWDGYESGGFARWSKKWP